MLAMGLSAATAPLQLPIAAAAVVAVVPLAADRVATVGQVSSSSAIRSRDVRVPRSRVDSDDANVTDDHDAHDQRIASVPHRRR